MSHARLLVCADEEDAEAIRFTRFRRVQQQTHIDAVGIDVGIDAAVGIAGQIGNDAAPIRRAIQSGDRTIRKNLVDRP